MGLADVEEGMFKLHKKFKRISFSSLSAEPNLLIEDMLAAQFVTTDSFPLTMDPEQAPWIWRGDSSVKIYGYYDDSRLAGVRISRHLILNNHLHALWIPPALQNMGAGKVLMNDFISDGLSTGNIKATFTLHIYKKNHSGLEFYRKLGFSVLDENMPLPNNDGLQEWINNCKNKGDWPLRNEIQLMWMPFKEV